MTRYLIRLVGAAVLTLFGAGLLLGFVAGRALAQAPSPIGQGDHHHPLHEDFYRTWQRPDGNGSCCNARIVHPNGGETGDCEPTEARLIANRWYARLPHAGPFIEVPDAAILQKLNPTQDGTDGHLCWTPSQGVMCFVPPFGGG